MKKLILTLASSLAACFAASADTITQWDFNFPTTATVFPSGDSDGLTGTFTPFIGSGTFNVLNVTSNRFGGTTASSDPWIADNSALRLAGFPATTAANKTAGVELFTSTVGYENIQVQFDQSNSATASRYWRAQYTIDGVNWIDHVVLASAGSTAWLNGRLVDLSTLPGVKNNANFGFRLVAEWESTATGSGLDGYVPNSGASYGSGGTHWMDVVTVLGTPLDTSNSDPTISAIADQAGPMNAAIGPIAFTVGDAETPASNLTLSAESSNPNVLYDITFGGSGANRTVTLTPQPYQYGLVQVTVTVTDGGGKAASTLFQVLFRPPTLGIQNIVTRANTAAQGTLTIEDSAGFQGSYTVSATAENAVLLPPGSVVLTGSGSTRTLTLTPAANQLGGSVVTVTATDGNTSVSTDLFFKVLDSSTITFWDFNSKTRDNAPTTGDISPALGFGTASSAGVATNSLISNVAAASFDLDQADNTKWRFGNFPVQSTDNKTAGAEFRLSTVGYEAINISWDHYNSSSGSRYWRLQYSLDGVNFVDFNTYINPLVTTWTNFSANLSSIAGANNNPNFAVRLVNEFESTATGSGADSYVGVGGGYSPNGTLWLDSVSFTGLPYSPANSTPTISPINAYTTRVNTATSPIAFTISDEETPAGSLVVSAGSSVPSVANSFTYGGSGNNRTITITPELNQTGTTEITVRVTDAGGKFADSTFMLYVLPDNTAHSFEPISHQTLLVNSTANVAVTVNDLEPERPLTFSVASSNPRLLPVEELILSGSGNNRSLEISPVANEAGGAYVTVTASDDQYTNSVSFVVKVVQPDTIALWNFNSPVSDGNEATGTTDPAIGSGTAAGVGTVVTSVTNTISADSFDPNITDSTKWRIGTFPAQGADNKTGGTEFRVSTAGYEDIAVYWEHYNSATASRYWRLQYSLDGINFFDHVVYTNFLVTTWRPTGASLSSIPGANNNPNFAIRIVSEFESTATQAGSDAYLGVQASGGYSTGGTLWLDMVTITGRSTVAPAVNLGVIRLEGSIRVSWSADVDGTLEVSSTLGGSWSDVAQSVVEDDGLKTVTIPVSGNQQFFRLRLQD